MQPSDELARRLSTRVIIEGATNADRALAAREEDYIDGEGTLAAPGFTTVDPSGPASAALLALQTKEEDLKGRRQDRKQRLKYAEKIFGLIKWWLISVVTLLVANGFDIKAGWFETFRLELSISDSVILALIGGTTASVLGLMAIVVKYLFSRGGERP